MTIAVVYRWPAMTAEQYKSFWSGSDGAPALAPGQLFHVGAGEGDAFWGFSVWESRQAYDNFAPGFNELTKAMGYDFGAPAILPVHNMIVPKAGE